MTTATTGATAPEVELELEQLRDNQRVARTRLFRVRQELREAENALHAANLAIEAYSNRKR